MTYPVALRFEGKLGLVFGGRGMGATPLVPVPLSVWNVNGSINCGGIIPCNDAIPCGV